MASEPAATVRRRGRLPSSERAEGRPSRFAGYPLAEVVLGVTRLSVVLLGMLAAIPLLLWWLEDNGSFRPETALPILLIGGTILLLLAVGTVTIAFGKMNLTSWKHPLGLPEGSIRALIALLLILLFFITAVFLYSNAANGSPDRVHEGVSATQVETIPIDETISREVTSGTGDTAIYRVVLRGEPNDASVDMAKSLLTTVGTLVVSVAAFYFGSRSVEVATQAVRAQAADEEEQSGEAPQPGTAEPEATAAASGTPTPTPVDVPEERTDPPLEDPLSGAETEDERLALSAQLLTDTDNSPRQEDGDQDPQLED